MAYDLINIGTPNGNNGDTIRDAFKKSNDNDAFLKGKVDAVELDLNSMDNTFQQYVLEGKHTSVFGGGNDSSWKKLVGIDFSQSTYAGASFDLEIIQSNGNHGQTANIDKDYYRISCIKSSGTVNSHDKAVIYGTRNVYVRVVKVSSAYHEIQVNPQGTHKTVKAVLTKLGSSGATITYFDSAPTSSVGTIYEVTTTPSGAVDNFIDLNANQITCVNLTETSDRQFKENIEVIDGEWALSVFRRLKFSQYDNLLSNRKDAGLIAQEVEQILPEAVHTASDGRKSLNYRFINTITSAAIQHFIKTQTQ